MRRKILCDGWKRKYFGLGSEVNTAYVTVGKQLRKVIYIYLFEPFIVLAKQSTLRGRSKMSIDLILPSIVLVLIDLHLNKSQATLAKVRSSLDSNISISKGQFLTQTNRERRGQNGREITLVKTSGETTLIRLCQLKNKSTKSIYTDRIQR
jgi:hypothetical protein